MYTKIATVVLKGHAGGQFRQREGLLMVKGNAGNI